MSINYTADDDMKRIQALDIARESGKVDLTGIERDRKLMRSFLTGPGKECEAFPSTDVVRLETELAAARAEAAALRGVLGWLKANSGARLSMHKFKVKASSFELGEVEFGGGLDKALAALAAKLEGR